MIQILVVPVNEAPYMKEIPNTLEALQELVGGYIECLKAGDGIHIVCNEEGKLMDLEPNIWIYGGMDSLAGQFIVVGSDQDGEFHSISKQQALQFVYTNVIGNKCNPALNVKIKWNLEEWRKSL